MLDSGTAPTPTMAEEVGLVVESRSCSYLLLGVYL